MAVIIDIERDAVIRDLLDKEFTNFTRDTALTPGTGEIAIDSSWSMNFLMSKTPMTDKIE